MTTRRGVLGAVGLAALSGALGACDQRQPTGQSHNPTSRDSDRLLIAHRSGLGVFDTGTRDWALKPAPAVFSGFEIATLDGQTLTVHNRSSLAVLCRQRLQEIWHVAAVSGTQVALVADTAKPRRRTRLRITRGDTERTTFDLPGTIEPEAFSRDGDRLFVLDHHANGETYRVRALDLQTGALDPLLAKEKKPLPPNGEESMRGQGRHAVYFPARDMLFSLYTHGGDHRHSGQLLGVRPDAPDIHAFIHALSLSEGWAVCIDLPAPFGDADAVAHTLAMSGNTLYAVNLGHGVVAEINPIELTIRRTSKVDPEKGEAFAVYTDRLLTAAGTRLAGRELGFPIKGLAKGERLWAGRHDGIVAIENGLPAEDIKIPGLITLR